MFVCLFSKSVLDCGTLGSLPNVTFTIGAGQQFELTPNEYVLKVKWACSNACKQRIARWVVNGTGYRPHYDGLSL